jgi:hypothetical protein
LKRKVIEKIKEENSILTLFVVVGEPTDTGGALFVV